jgi:hypothetical protein
MIFFFWISKSNIIRKTQSAAKYTEYTREASKKEKKKEQENH